MFSRSLASRWLVVSRSSSQVRRTSFDCCHMDPQNLNIPDELRTFLGYDIEMAVATERSIMAAIERYYSSESESVEKLVSHLPMTLKWKRQRGRSGWTVPSIWTAQKLWADSVSVRKLLNLVLLLAIKDHASDIHFEPLKTNSESESKQRAFFTRWFRRLATWLLRLRLAFKVMANT